MKVFFMHTQLGSSPTGRRKAGCLSAALLVPCAGSGCSSSPFVLDSGQAHHDNRRER